MLTLNAVNAARKSPCTFTRLSAKNKLKSSFKNSFKSHWHYFGVYYELWVILPHNKDVKTFSLTTFLYTNCYRKPWMLILNIFAHRLIAIFIGVSCPTFPWKFCGLYLRNFQNKIPCLLHASYEHIFDSLRLEKRWNIRGYPLSTFAKFSEKLTFLTRWYAHRVRIRGLEMLVFRKNLGTYLMDNP